MNATSLAKARPLAIAECMSGHQVSHCGGGPEDPIRANINIGITVQDAKVITNHGMICTNTRVFNVARFAVFEFKPIHIPNQLNAARLPAIARLVMKAMARMIRSEPRR